MYVTYTLDFADFFFFFFFDFIKVFPRHTANFIKLKKEKPYETIVSVNVFTYQIAFL